MVKYKFTWEMEFEGEDFQDCLDQLEGTIKDPDNTATCYTVSKCWDGYDEKLKGYADFQHETVLSKELKKSIELLEERQD